jgi:WD40 repeat protein
MFRIATLDPRAFFRCNGHPSKVMKANITLNARPLLRALYVVLITCTALLAMPKRADAQVYVSLVLAGVVSEYDEKTGEVINASFITGLSGPNELVLAGEDLYIANDGGSVGKYNAKTGAAISQSFITGADLVPVGLALLGDDLFVASADGSVGKYNAKTGTAINADFISGLPSGPVCGLGKLGDILFVANNAGTVGKYNDKTGKSLGGFDVESPYGIAFLGDKLFVGSSSTGTIAEYNAKTLKVINASFITGLSGPWQIAVLDDKLFVTNAGLGTIGEYSAKTGKVINAAFISIPSESVGIAVKAQSK